MTTSAELIPISTSGIRFLPHPSAWWRGAAFLSSAETLPLDVLEVRITPRPDMASRSFDVSAFPLVSDAGRQELAGITTEAVLPRPDAGAYATFVTSGSDLPITAHLVERFRELVTTLHAWIQYPFYAPLLAGTVHQNTFDQGPVTEENLAEEQQFLSAVASRLQLGFPYDVPTELSAEAGQEIEEIMREGPPDWVRELRAQMNR